MQKVEKKKLPSRKRKRRLRPVIKYTLAVFAVLLCAGMIFFLLNPFFLESDTITAEYQGSFDPRSSIRFVAFGSPDDVEVSGSVDTSKKGTTTLTYSMFWETREVQVEVRDTTPPSVVSRDVETDMSSSLEPMDFIKSVSDAQSVTFAFESEPDWTKEGKQTVSITASDADGNQTAVEAQLILHKDTTPPVMSGVLDSYEISQGNEVEITGIHVEDDLDPHPYFQMDTSQVDTTVPGTYTVKATVSDRSGNTAEQDLQVVVKENPLYGKRVVYLTFDDGPSENTDKVLDVLKKNNVKATFFVTGNGQEYNDSIKRAYDEGNTIGLHTYSHNYASVYASDDAYFADLQQVSDMVKNITGEESKIIRFPGGSSNTVSENYSQGIMSRLVQEVRDRGYQYFDWNVSSSDAAGSNVAVEQITANAEAQVADDWTGSLVILFHDASDKETTVEALQDIIDYYKKEGFVFAPLELDSYPAHHAVSN